MSLCISSEVLTSSAFRGCQPITYKWLPGDSGHCWPSAADEEWYSPKRPSSTVAIKHSEENSIQSWVAFFLMINKMKIKDIITYHSKDWRLIDYIAIHLSIHYCTKVLQGARKLYPWADHHLVREMWPGIIWHNPMQQRYREKDTTWLPRTLLPWIRAIEDVRAVDFLLVSVIYHIAGKFRRRKCSWKS